MRISIIHPSPAPYRENLFETISNFPNSNLMVYYCRAKVFGYRDWNFKFSNYPQEILPGRELGKGFLFNHAIMQRLLKRKPDILAIWGWSYPTAQIAMMAGKLLGIPVILFSASITPKKTSYVIEQAKKLLVRIPQSFLVPGKLAKNYLINLGLKERNIYELPINCIDSEWWHKQSHQARINADIIKNKLGICQKNVILYVGRLIPGKGGNILIDAFAELSEKRKDIALLIAGGGTEKHALEKKVSNRNLKNICFLGSQPYETLPAFYGISNLMAFPTFYDTWGLVVLESLACGVPVITTTSCGAVPDLINNKGTGLVVEPGDPDSLAQAMNRILSLSPNERETMRQRSFSVASAYDYRLAARAFVDICAKETEKHKKRKRG